MWSNLGYDLNNIILNSNIVFGIKTTDELKPLKSIEYYVHNSTTPLNKNEIETNKKLPKTEKNVVNKDKKEQTLNNLVNELKLYLNEPDSNGNFFNTIKLFPIDHPAKFF